MGRHQGQEYRVVEEVVVVVVCCSEVFCKLQVSVAFELKVQHMNGHTCQLYLHRYTQVHIHVQYNQTSENHVYTCITCTCIRVYPGTPLIHSSSTVNSSLILHLKLLAGSKPCGHLHLYHLAIGALHLNQLATDCAWRNSNRHYLRLWNSNHGVW